MSIVHQKDKRSGITYVYESYSYRDKETGKPRSKRTLIGRLDEATGEVIATDGRCRKEEGYSGLPKTVKECREMIMGLMKENERLKAELEAAEKKG